MNYELISNHSREHRQTKPRCPNKVVIILEPLIGPFLPHPLRSFLRAASMPRAHALTHLLTQNLSHAHVRENSAFSALFQVQFVKVEYCQGRRGELATHEVRPFPNTQICKTFFRGCVNPTSLRPLVRVSCNLIEINKPF